ncbi:hypothetical protein NDU88_001768 [Pleurodeles waltl]|uniref:Uncharacterized protein n=1 Tax=Pleurodeles waltl TaxID=8319 RepID=A0AAV7NBS6_PLEWA|nr:hypothetical protein NDU88_001768 [Pleurodeles waltl]
MPRWGLLRLVEGPEREIAGGGAWRQRGSCDLPVKARSAVVSDRSLFFPVGAREAPAVGPVEPPGAAGPGQRLLRVLRESGKWSWCLRSVE